MKPMVSIASGGLAGELPNALATISVASKFGNLR